jgi:hypothetical protein
MDEKCGKEQGPRKDIPWKSTSGVRVIPSIGQDIFGNVWNRPTGNRRRVCTAFPVYLRLILRDLYYLGYTIGWGYDAHEWDFGNPNYLFPWLYMGVLLHFLL